MREAPQPERPPLRRRLGILAGALVGLVAIGVAITGSLGGGGGLARIDPDHLALIDADTNEVVASTPVGTAPGPLALGDGSLWVGNTGDRDLMRVDPHSRTVLATLALDGIPTGIAAGGGAVWIAIGPRGTIAHVDPGYARVAGHSLRLASPSQRGSVALGGGSLWAVFGDSTLVRLDAGDGRPRARGTAGAAPSGVVYAAGAVWVANNGTGTVSRFEPRSFTSGPAQTVPVGEHPVGIAYGDGALWVANAGDGTVTRIDPRSPSSRATVAIRVGGRPAAIAAGEGAVWVAGADGEVARIDPAERRVTKRISLGNPAAGIAAGDGSVWVSVIARPPK